MCDTVVTRACISGEADEAERGGSGAGGVEPPGLCLARLGEEETAARPAVEELWGVSSGTRGSA